MQLSISNHALGRYRERVLPEETCSNLELRRNLVSSLKQTGVFATLADIANAHNPPHYIKLKMQTSREVVDFNFRKVANTGRRYILTTLYSA